GGGPGAAPPPPRRGRGKPTSGREAPQAQVSVTTSPQPRRPRPVVRDAAGDHRTRRFRHGPPGRVARRVRGRLRRINLSPTSDFLSGLNEKPENPTQSTRQEEEG